MDAATRASALFIAACALIAGLHWLRDVLTPFAIAVFLWLVMDSFANAIKSFAPRLPRAATLAAASLIVLLAAAAVAVVITNSAIDFVDRFDVYRARLDELIARAYALFGNTAPPTIAELLLSPDLQRFLRGVVGEVQALGADAVFVLIYVGFLFAAQSSWPKKMKELFREPDRFRNARSIMGSIRESIERYLWVQTVISAIISFLSYVTMAALGLDNALFWAFLIFLLNYVPTIGSIVAAALPTLFAFVQYPDAELWKPFAIFAGLSVWQFGIGNFVQPRMQGESLNLATIVVLLSLALWGVIWGIPGMFLSSPLTVILMIVLAQFSATRWIAVLLSADGKPDARPPRLKVRAATLRRRAPPRPADNAGNEG